MVLLLSVILILPCVPMAYADGESGSCGANLTWKLTGGTLTITGTGKMTDFTQPDMVPWYAYRDKILQVELPEGLESVGSLAFYECGNLLTVRIPDSVETIGAFAFSDCIKLQMVTFGNRVHSINEAAFQNCYRLKSISFPNSLIVIGVKAFYRCEDVTTLQIPANVMAIGDAAFGYCKSLVSADIQAMIGVIPEFLFYGCGKLTSISLPDTTSSIDDLAFWGCDQLETVHYNGVNQSLSEVEQVLQGNQSSTGNGTQTQGNTGSEVNKPVSSTTQSSSDGTVKQETITVIQGENVTGSSKVETEVDEQSGTKTDVNITITVENQSGWQEAADIVETLLNNSAATGDQSETVIVDVYVKNTENVDSSILSELAGKNVIINVTTSTGSTWKIDCSQLDKNAVSGSYNLSHTLTVGGDALTAELGGSASFILKFSESTKVNAEVLVRLGSVWQNQEATLFQLDEDGISKLQATLVDRDGYAHFYLASVDEEMEYYIGINVSSAKQEAIIPDTMHDEYRLVDHSTGMEYIITGRKSSWNMGLGKVMAILAVVMVSAVGVIGFVMYFWNKQRLKSGYVPKWDDEDETTV